MKGPLAEWEKWGAERRIGSITSHCSGKEPVLLPQGGPPGLDLRERQKSSLREGGPFCLIKRGSIFGPSTVRQKAKSRPLPFVVPDSTKIHDCMVDDRHGTAELSIIKIIVNVREPDKMLEVICNEIASILSSGLEILLITAFTYRSAVDNTMLPPNKWHA